MSWNQKSVIAILVFSNLLVYVYGYLAWQILATPQPAVTQPSEMIALDIAPSPTSTPTATLTPIPTSTATPTLTPTPAPTEITVTSTSTPRPLAARARPRATATLTPPAVQNATNTFGPLQPGDAWKTLPPKTSVWYKLGNGGDHIDALLQAQPLEAVKMEVFAPDAPDHPIGQGSPQRGVDGLSWSGGHWNSTGDWLARITNTSPAAVQYRVVSATYVIGHCDSESYWEYVGPNLTYWTRCK